MSKRCEIQKKYHKKFGNYKGEGKYTDHYVSWLEDELKKMRLGYVSSRSFTNIIEDFRQWQREWDLFNSRQTLILPEASDAFVKKIISKYI